jgi:hypothetical protein
MKERCNTPFSASANAGSVTGRATESPSGNCVTGPSLDVKSNEVTSEATPAFVSFPAKAYLAFGSVS